MALPTLSQPSQVKGCGVSWMNSQSLPEITSESKEFLRSFSTVFQQHATVYNEDAEVESALSPYACPLPQCHRELWLTEMEGLLFDSAPGGLLIVSKWSPPATALIIRDPSCMLEDRRGGWDQQSCSCVCVCVWAVKRKRKRSRRDRYRQDKETLRPKKIRWGERRSLSSHFSTLLSSKHMWVGIFSTLVSRYGIT